MPDVAYCFAVAGSRFRFGFSFACKRTGNNVPKLFRCKKFRQIYCKIQKGAVFWGRSIYRDAQN